MARTSNNSLFSFLSDVRNDPVVIIPELIKQPIAVQERFVHLFIAYVRSMASYYKYGYFPNGTQNIAVLCKQINDQGLDPIATLPQYEHGDILMEG